MKNLMQKFPSYFFFQAVPCNKHGSKNPPPPPTLKEAKPENKTDIVSILTEEQKFAQQATEPITVGEEEIAAQGDTTTSIAKRLQQAIYDQADRVQKNAALANAQRDAIVNSSASISLRHTANWIIPRKKSITIQNKAKQNERF